MDTKNNRIVNKIIITNLGMTVYENAKKIALEYAIHIESIVGEKQAKECSKFLHKIKNTVTQSTKIVFE